MHADGMTRTTSRSRSTNSADADDHSDVVDMSMDINNSNKEIDGLLLRELLKLSVVDRNAIHEEIHGVDVWPYQKHPN